MWVPDSEMFPKRSVLFMLLLVITIKAAGYDSLLLRELEQASRFKVTYSHNRLMAVGVRIEADLFSVVMQALGCNFHLFLEELRPSWVVACEVAWDALGP